MDLQIFIPKSLTSLSIQMACVLVADDATYYSRTIDREAIGCIFVFQEMIFPQREKHN